MSLEWHGERMTTFVDRYGPWALVAGASDGVGAAFARAMAERGLNVVLLARRQGLLDEVAAGIRAESGVETRTGAGLVGASNMVAYAATKAFDMVMAEALWAELHDDGVDVLALVLGLTDTPALRQLLAKRGVLHSADDPSPIPGASTAAEVVADAIANLANGPTWFVGEQLRQGAVQLGGMPRSDAVKMMVQHGGATMNPSTPVQEASH